MQRFLLLLFGIFAALALLLACIGIYGVLAYLTSQRVPEIGVRMALGATARNVVRLVLRQSLAMILVGRGRRHGGVAGGGDACCSDWWRECSRAESATFAITIAVLVVAALFASFLPARRAGRMDPVTALRQE